MSKAEGLETDHPRETGGRLGLAAPGNIGAGGGGAFQEMLQTRHHLLLLTAVGPAVPRWGCKQLRDKGHLAHASPYPMSPCPRAVPAIFLLWVPALKSPLTVTASWLPGFQAKSFL